MNPCHLAFPVHNLEEARAFYLGCLGCTEGRSAKTWVDFNLYGHQIVAHYVADYNASATANQVDGDPVPVPHFGVVLSVEQFHALANKLKALPGFQFVIHPHLRFEGAPGEQWTMFFKDPSGNALEFKAMRHPDNLFAKYTVD
uniref:Glyoxalase/fosfomycin resistance/dioxygenase domain-containing protein n=1 Tax=Dunaliella tertiolecta TaxID=3047 RepID=A0A6S8IA82_DUNTE|mmetsp:Transcript_26775/g.72322  ORF Transcript_26775/g.72322 Transcript_26775/m.72322 type:complete len:143 (+) Transcript_26775:44-472(+)